MMRKMIISAILGALILTAAASLSCHFGKTYALTTEYYTAKAGDTMWSIAENYYEQQDKTRNFNEFLHNLRMENGFTSGRRVLQVGDIIAVPLYCEVK